MTFLKIMCGVAVIVFIATFLSAPQQGFSETGLTDLPISETPVVLELFTSQGCSSCPPADRFAEILSQRNNLILLSCHVTYWDYIGWKDTLGNKSCDNYQQHITPSFLGKKRVYTPQMIINGHKGMVGSHTQTILNTIIQEQKKSLGEITIFKNENEITFDLPDMAQEAPYYLRAFFIQSSQITPIGRGENRKKTINYVQNVKSIYEIGQWDGTEKTKSFILLTPPNTDQIIILAKEGTDGAVRAVGRMKF